MTLVLPKLFSTPSPNYSSRGGRKITRIVVHDCEGSYEGSIAWFMQTRSRVSAHYVLSEDGARATRMVAEANKAWHACDANPWSIGVEAAGYQAKGYGAPEWRALANITAFLLRKYGLPCAWTKDSVGGAGFCSHYDLGAFGGNHDDPTTDAAVWAAFVTRVQDAYGEDMPASWSPGGDAPAPAAPAGFTPSGDARHDQRHGSLEWAQIELNALGFATPPLIVDGIEGDATRAAARRFQIKAGFVGDDVDGIVGPKTITALEAATA